MLSNLPKFQRFPLLLRSRCQNPSQSLRTLTQFQCHVTSNDRIPRKSLNLVQISHQRHFSTPLPPSNNLDEVLIDANTYEIVCSETLESLCEYFDEILESNSNLKDADILYGDGVLTVKLGANRGTYVINRQSPNRQLWLSSPISGPKRYDFIPTNTEMGDKSQGYWIYKHDGVTLHELLQSEIPGLIGTETDFTRLSHGSR